MSQIERLTTIVKKISGKEPAPTPDESLFESGYLDSFALPDLISALEAEYRIRIPDGDVTPRKFDSIERIAAYLESRA